ncbi:thiaminase II [Parendozoicomonas haliclonae]|uniref:Aminopyrimidine aminohydrolase n=1 Tax=Parendozoicomonas haliclonae TaxID=1960125 RepID=A0A1X7AL22_9GAMM|nr:thiaminase II [Parendozoicomonas haliclonae]SMA48496.1 Thiaminase-2 [Parendozoicomonas haliclonae]
MNTADLIASCQQDWNDYTRHRFLIELGNGTLPKEVFQHYLEQDYLFLIQFSRAYALAVYKSDNFAEMRKPLEALHGLISHETRLHVEYCEQWGLTEQDMMNIPEATGTVAYTRLVLDAGQSGSLTDLYAALAPCSIGYGHIGRWLANSPNTVWEGNPYREWIETYNGEEYQAGVQASQEQLDELLAEIPDDSRSAARIKKIFRSATCMEVAFWEQGYEALAS